MMTIRNLALLPALLLALLAAGPSLAEDAGASSAADLVRTISAMDTKLFDAYNRCDLDTMAALVSDDLEFYHDQTGLSRGRAPFIAAIKANVCGKVRRELLPETLEVYPLHGYGAVEIGEHVFCDPRKTPTCDARTSGVAKFVMLWRLQGGAWQLTRVISYNHVSDWQRHDRP